MAEPSWLTVGKALIGTHEISGKNDNPVIMGMAKELGGDIAKEYVHDEVPWCALFANYVLHKSGIAGTNTLWALDFASWGMRLAGPALGAIAPMKRSGGGGHVVFIVGRDAHGNLMGLGGNQSDAVNIKPFPLWRPLSFRWPKEAELPKDMGFARLPLMSSTGKIVGKES